MNSGGVLSRGAAIGFLLGLVLAILPPPAHAGFNVGAPLRTITPMTGAGVDPTCDTQGGTSMAIVQGSKLAGVDPSTDPNLKVLLAISCLDNGSSTTSVTRRSRVNFINPSNGVVVKSLVTRTSTVNPFAANNGWAHLVHRPDFGDLLGCGNDGTIYSINFSQFDGTTNDGLATSVPRPAGLLNNCVALGWDAEEDMIYQGISGGTSTVGVYRFKSGTTTLVTPTFNTPCTPSGVAITGGVLLVACDGISTILRLDKRTGAILAVNGTLGVLGFSPGATLNPDLGDLACDPVTFQSQFKDAMWSRRGFNGNGVVALEFPAFTCGLPSNATVLAPGLSGPAFPASCFDTMTGNVKDTDGDGLPDCWEDGTLWPDGLPGIDFDGDGVRDLTLCVPVDTNGDGVADTTECADKNHKDLFVEIDWMQNHKPDPLALSQSLSVASVGVKSVREAFATAPVANPDATSGIRIHSQVDEQVTFTTLAGTGPTSHVSQLAFTPCTGPGSFAISQSDAADFDTIKKANFGTAAQRANANTLNAKRLAFRYMLFAHNQVGTSAGAGTSASGCSEVPGDDSAITLGSFTSTTVGGVTHNRGSTDQQSGTVMHELGHNLGLRHGGGDNNNCKPNYLSVMNYSRQFADFITNRRLDYSRGQLPTLTETAPPGLDEMLGIGTLTFFPFLSGDKTVYSKVGTLTTSAVVVSADGGIDWSGDGMISGTTTTTKDINKLGTSVGCDGTGTVLPGFDDWQNLQYSARAALDFAAGVHTANTAEHQDKDAAQEQASFEGADNDGDGVPDVFGCDPSVTPLSPPSGSSVRCAIDIKPNEFPNVVSLGNEANINVAILSLRDINGVLIFDAPGQVVRNSLTLNGIAVKLNSKQQGTCSVRDTNGDGLKDLVCQFPSVGLPLGGNFAILEGLAVVGMNTSAIRARDFVTVVK